MDGKSIKDSKGISHQEYVLFCSFLQNRCGILLGDNKEYLVSSRLHVLMKELDISTISDLLDKVNRGGVYRLQEKIIDAMTTNETSWFRDSYPYNAMKDVILADIAKQGGKSPRIWSAACSSGQEPYSLAITIQEYMVKHPGQLTEYKIIATDISESMLGEARAGEYDASNIQRGLTEDRLALYFTKTSDSKWSVRSSIREKITFQEINLLSGFTLLGTFDVILCRNVLIYFSVDVKKDILSRMLALIKPGGYLILGGSESITGIADRVETVKYGSGLIYKKK